MVIILQEQRECLTKSPNVLDAAARISRRAPSEASSQQLLRFLPLQAHPLTLICVLEQMASFK